MIQSIEGNALPFVSAVDDIGLVVNFREDRVFLDETAVTLTGNDTSVSLFGFLIVTGSEPAFHFDGSGDFSLFSSNTLVEGTAVFLTGDHTGGTVSGLIQSEVLVDARSLSGGVDLAIGTRFPAQFLQGDVFLTDHDDELRVLDDSWYSGEINAGAGSDDIYGAQDDEEGDVIRGEDGNDRIWLFSGRDRASGGAGDDELYGGGSRDRLYGGAGQDEIFGGTGDDGLFGRSGNDVIYGDDGRDRLGGGGGDDSLFGGSDRDVLVGHAGNDTLSGGAGADRFVFRDDAGVWTDTISDFQHGVDAIRFENSVVESLDELTIMQVGDDVQIAYSDDFILVLDTDVGDFVTSDILFG